MKLVGWVLGKRAGRRALGLPKRLAGFCGWQATQRGMRPDEVVVVSPERQLATGLGEAVEDFLVEAFVAQASIEAFVEGVLLRPSGVGIMPLDAVVLGPFQDRRLVNSVPLSLTMLVGLP